MGSLTDASCHVYFLLTLSDPAMPAPLHILSLPKPHWSPRRPLPALPSPPLTCPPSLFQEVCLGSFQFRGNQTWNSTGNTMLLKFQIYSQKGLEENRAETIQGSQSQLFFQPYDPPLLLILIRRSALSHHPDHSNLLLCHPLNTNPVLCHEI